MKAGQSLKYEMITDNVMIVTMDKSVWLDNELSIDQMPFHYFRDGHNDKGQVTYAYVAKPPAQLTHDDVMAINKHLDAAEGDHNQDVKELIASALATHFNGVAFHLNDLGCGHHPLLDYFNGNEPSYHGIESDPDCIKTLKNRGLKASDGSHITNPAGRPVVSAAIYALHFMVNENTPDLIKEISPRKNSFLIANYYTHPHEKLYGNERKRLKKIFDKAGLLYATMTAPQDPNNEYWIIGKKKSARAIRGFAISLSATNRQLHGYSMDLT